jgi:hypothetical protein
MTRTRYAALVSIGTGLAIAQRTWPTTVAGPGQLGRPLSDCPPGRLSHVYRTFGRGQVPLVLSTTKGTSMTESGPDNSR